MDWPDKVNETILMGVQCVCWPFPSTFTFNLAWGGLFSFSFNRNATILPPLFFSFFFFGSGWNILNGLSTPTGLDAVVQFNVCAVCSWGQWTRQQRCRKRRWQRQQRLHYDEIVYVYRTFWSVFQDHDENKLKQPSPKKHSHILFCVHQRNKIKKI